MDPLHGMTADARQGYANGFSDGVAAARRWRRRRRRANHARAMWAARRAYLRAFDYPEIITFDGLEAAIKAYRASLAAPPSPRQRP